MIESVSTNIPLFDASELSEFRRRVINKGKKLDEGMVTKERLNFIEQVLAPKNEFLSWFRNCFPLSDPHEVTCRIPVERLLSEGELDDPPDDTEKSLAQILIGVPPKQAALPAFWASYNIELLQQGVIKDQTYFAKPRRGGTASTGRGTLEQIMQGDHKEIDDCIRTLCRRMLGGAPEERGQVSVYTDPRIARAWWRGYIARQTQEDLNIKIDEVWEALRKPSATWEQLVQHVVRKLTHVGERSIRSALVARFVEMRRDHEDNAEQHEERIVSLLAATGQRTARQSLGSLNAHEVLEVLREIGEPIS